MGCVDMRFFGFLPASMCINIEYAKIRDESFPYVHWRVALRRFLCSILGVRIAYGVCVDDEAVPVCGRQVEYKNMGRELAFLVLANTHRPTFILSNLKYLVHDDV